MHVVHSSEIKKKFRLLSNGVRQGPDLITVEYASQTLAIATLDVLEKIIIHDSWAAACLVHHSLRKLPFVNDALQRASAKEKCETLIRKRIENRERHMRNNQSTSSSSQPVAVVGSCPGNGSFTCVRVCNSWNVRMTMKSSGSIWQRQYGPQSETSF